jgi:5-methylcytosine-specific restriction enzyme B
MLDERIESALRANREEALDQGILLPDDKLATYYQTFRMRFGPDVLASWDGQALLDQMHDTGPDGLVYWLEFKNDDEFPAIFGSISGGSALKFGIYRRRETGEWMTGSPQNQIVLPVDKAIEVAKKHREQLIRGCEILDAFPEGAEPEAYVNLQEQLAKVAPDIQDSAWVHKYFSLLYPNKLDDFHVERNQRYYLHKLLITHFDGKGRYVHTGYLMAAAHSLGFSSKHFASAMIGLWGEVNLYWRIMARYQKPYRDGWPEMRDSSTIAIGWKKIGDLSEILKGSNIRKRIEGEVTNVYPELDNMTANVREIYRLSYFLEEGDTVIVSHGTQALGIGKINGPYEYHAGSEFPHRRPVEWLSIDDWEIPVKEPGLRHVVGRVRRSENLIATEQHMLAGKKEWPVELSKPIVSRLKGIPHQIQRILDRKGQVLLYGPPGTGKTHWAEHTALALSALHNLNQNYDDLSNDEKERLRSPSGYTRMCTFHPAYSYEDFIEGYRPSLHSGQVGFTLQDGIFKGLCKDAKAEPDKRFYLIVDEINRGDIPRIFGELISLLEKNKRGKTVLLPSSGHSFDVPANVYVIGTMNTADRSIALLDTALRRRFGFISLMPDVSVLNDTAVGGIPIGDWLKRLNQKILTHIGRDARNLQVGHAFFFDNGNPITAFSQFTRILQEDIVPLLEEYCYEDFDTLGEILGTGLIDVEGQRIRAELFEGNDNRLKDAILMPFPEIMTSRSAVSADGEDEDIEEEDEMLEDEAN